MLVCHCAVVNDRTIRKAIADGARDVLAVAEECGAGAFCGGCQPTIIALLAEAGVPAAAAAEGPSPTGPRSSPFRSVVRRIEEDVLAAGWVGGEMLGDPAALARRYGCTRAILQRAVAVLEHHGVVVADDADGQVRVAQPTARAVAEGAALHLWSAGTRPEQLIAARRVLEGAMVVAAAEARADRGVASLRAWLRRDGAGADPRESALALHLAVAEASGNPAFAVLADTLIQVTRLHRGVAPRRAADETAASLAEHRTIAEAVLDGDGPAALRASNAHIEGFYARNSAAADTATGATGPPASATALARLLAREVHRRGLRPGELLGTQAELRERFAVDDATLRQAATLLDYYAVAHPRVGGEEGVVVSTPDPWPTAQLLALYLDHVELGHTQLHAIRRPLELAAVAAAAQAISAEGVARLRQRLAEEHRVADGKDGGSPGPGEHDLHVILADLSGDPVLRLFVDAIRLVAVRAMSGGTVRRAVPDASGRILADHEGLVAAVTAGDVADARRRMADHLAWLASAAERIDADA